MSWAYWDRGVVAWVPEYSPGPDAWVQDYDGDGEIGPLEEMRFNTEELGGRYFSPWRSFQHPDRGAVEIGGWHSKFWGQNPPAEFLEEECRAQVPWILFLLQASPSLALEGPWVTPLGDGRFRVQVAVTNEGYLPTSLTGRGAVGVEGPGGVLRDPVVRPPHVVLKLKGVEMVEGAVRVPLAHLRGHGPFLTDVGAPEQTVEWIVRLVGDEGQIRVVALSETAGVVRSEWTDVR
jgi:hypothetical protein